MTKQKKERWGGGVIKDRNVCQSEILILKINVVGVFIFFLQTWFNNRRVKARNEFDRKKSKDRHRRKSTGDVTYKIQQTTTPDWRLEQTIDPSDKRVHYSQKERKRAYRKRSMMYIPQRRPLHPDRAAEDLVMERDAELIDDKEYHEILYDSDW